MFSFPLGRCRRGSRAGRGLVGPWNLNECEACEQEPEQKDIAGTGNSFLKSEKGKSDFFSAASHKEQDDLLEIKCS